MGLNGYYLIISIYGWFLWSREKGSTADGPPVTRLEPRLGMLLGLITVAGFFAIGWSLDRFTDSPLPYWDAFTTAASFTATWMLARKILEHWIVWVIVDAVSMGLYLYRGLFPTLFLFAVYTVMAVTGFIQWKRSLQHTDY
jgi:nicotinamide mononucleotide transporter